MTDDRCSDTTPLLRVSDIARFKAELDADLQLYQELPARIEHKRRLYEAALMFAPPASTSQTESQPDVVERALVARDSDDGPHADGLTWIGELERILDNATHGLPHKKVLEMLKATPLGERQVAPGDKNFYNAITRLERKGRLLKNNGLLYSPVLIEKMKRQGEELPSVTTEMRRRAGGAAPVALDLLRKHADGLTATDLRAALMKLPAMPDSLVKHEGYVYVVLKRLIADDAIYRTVDGKYRVKNSKEGP